MGVTVVMVDKAAVSYQRKLVKIHMPMHRRGNRGVQVGTVCAGDTSLIVKIVLSYFFVIVLHKASLLLNIINGKGRLCQWGVEKFQYVKNKQENTRINMIKNKSFKFIFRINL